MRVQQPQVTRPTDLQSPIGHPAGFGNTRSLGGAEAGKDGTNRKAAQAGVGAHRQDGLGNRAFGGTGDQQATRERIGFDNRRGPGGEVVEDELPELRLLLFALNDAKTRNGVLDHDYPHLRTPRREAQLPFDGGV